MGLPNRIVLLFAVLLMLFQFSYEECSAQKRVDQNRNSALDIAAIEQVTGMEGTENEGEYKLTVPQNDLNITVDGFRIIPPMGMGSWAAFTPVGDEAVLMGDVVILGNEIGPVQKELAGHGLNATGIHNHFMRDEPGVMYMHIGGKGTEESLAKGVKAVFDKIAELRGGNPADAEAATVDNTLDTDRIAEILGHQGEMNRGVYKITIGRPDVNLMAHGTRVSTFMGFNTWAAWQGTPENAAVSGDFTMLADEVEPVVNTLIKNNVEVVALHNHMIHEDPRIFFLHYWGTGNAEDLAKGLKEALDQTGS